ncbi:phenylacetate--CoA ligase family protein [Nostoc punctiforme FACHB-252]|uniref:Phenylacetate--CoA ligase family protein n=1 Tax=Nostoc punctiforme FACHB-252 TaxID=1357509 RepID=A0ABR8HHU2_NOSPU|nr:phenylacetate--CoA ligase family protein [Nostoc punctiforme]MBD2614926.1 phenylacetate--CoA ligase family protein [Nostoc punctiforme FACHB-252]
MNIRKYLYFSYAYCRQYNFPQLYNKFVKESSSNISIDTTRELLTKLLLHCQKSVPYYAKFMNNLSSEEIIYQKPELYLKQLPILTKDIIRANFEELKSTDLAQRQWYLNTSGGSTGEPIILIQDAEYNDKSTAISLLFSYLVGRELGEPEVRLWGSEKDVFDGTMGWKATFFNFWKNTIYMNAFQMTPQRMRDFLKLLNTKPPKLIVAYAQAIYELAKFAEDENIKLVPQKAIITSAGTLYAWMRQKIETVFQCKVFNRYGSREVSDVACEKPEMQGLWVAPWGNYIEIVDDDYNPVPPGVEGNILITSLTNFAMPLIRYKIGDRGTLSPEYKSGQILQQVSGRNVDTFKAENGTLIDGEYFTHLLYFKNWVQKFQIIQKSYLEITIKIIKSNSDYFTEELDDIASKCKLMMGKDCVVNFEFVNHIPVSNSGKYRYTISEVI